MVTECIVPPLLGESGQRSSGTRQKPHPAVPRELRSNPARMWQLLVHEHRLSYDQMKDIRNPRPDGVPMLPWLTR